MLTAMHIGLSEIYESLSDGVGQGVEDSGLAKRPDAEGLDDYCRWSGWDVGCSR